VGFSGAEVLMARLPDANAMGGLPSANSGRISTPSIDASPVGKAMESVSSGMMALAQGQQALGRGIAEGINQVKVEVDRHAQIGETLLEGQRNIERMTLAEKIATENNPDTIAELRGQYAKIDENYAAKIADPQRRALAMNKWQQQTAASVIDANSRHRTLYNNTVLDSANNILEEQRRLGVASNDPKIRQSAIDGANAQFDKLFAAGVIKNAEELKEKKRKFADSFTFDRFQQLPASERMAAAGGWRGALRGRESRHNPAIVNDFGFAGLYQFGAPRLQTLGVYSPGANEDMSGWNKSSKGAQGKWSGTFNVPGFPNVKTLKDFLSDPAAQEAVFDVHQNKMDQEIKSMGLEKFIGEERGGVKLTRESIYAMMHLGGAGGAADALKGVRNREDAYGTRVMDYARLGAEGGSSEAAQLYRIMPPERQIQVRQIAERDYKADLVEFEREQKRIQQDWNATFDTRVENAGAAVMATGRLPDQAPTEPEFVQRYGEREGKERAAKFKDTVELGQNVQRFGQMSDAEAKALIESEKPDVNDPLFETRQKSYELLQKAYAQDRAAREKDPAAYVQSKFPDLDEGWKNADTNDPNQVAALMTRSQSYQRQLGIPADKQRLLPAPVVSRAIEIFKNQDASQPERLAAIKSLAFASSDDVQRKAVFKQLEAAGMPGMYRAVFNAEARGDEGAARRLAAAAMADQSKLKSVDPKVAGPNMINDKIRTAIFGVDTIGDAVYGLSAGRVENRNLAEDDSSLLTSYVRMQVEQGKDLDSAVEAGIKDIYGKVKVYNRSNALLAISEGEDEDRIDKGLMAATNKVRAALDARIPPAPPASAPAAEREAHRLAVLQVQRSNKDLIATGEWRSFGKDVAFVDKTTGMAVSQVGGKPLLFAMDDLKAEAPKAVPPPDAYSGAETPEARDARMKKAEQGRVAQPISPTQPKQQATFGGGSTRLPQ
jgi:hypothetical protein